MDQNELVQTVREMTAASSCCRELKEAGQNWIAAADADAKKKAAAILLEEIREDIAPIDHVIEFFESPQGIQIFGADRAKSIAAHAREVRAQGGKWCDCPACAAGLKILENAALLSD